MNVAIVVGEGDRMETGSAGSGGRVVYDLYLDPQHWKAQVDEALRQALSSQVPTLIHLKLPVEISTSRATLSSIREAALKRKSQ